MKKIISTLLIVTFVLTAFGSPAIAAQNVSQGSIVALVQIEDGIFNLLQERNDSGYKLSKELSYARKVTDEIYEFCDSSGVTLQTTNNKYVMQVKPEIFVMVEKNTLSASASSGEISSKLNQIQTDDYIKSDLASRIEGSRQAGLLNATYTIYSPAQTADSVTYYTGYNGLSYCDTLVYYDSSGYGGYEYLAKGVSIDPDEIAEEIILFSIGAASSVLGTIASIFSTFFNSLPNYRPVTGDFVQARMREKKITKYTAVYMAESSGYRTSCCVEKTNGSTNLYYYGKFNNSNFYKSGSAYSWTSSAYAQADKFAYMNRYSTPYNDTIDGYEADHNGYSAVFYSY